jgi:PAS domain S-box-containing protein
VQGEQEGALELKGRDAGVREVKFIAKANVLPLRHLVALQEGKATEKTPAGSTDPIPLWVQDYALYLIDTEGCIAAWYSGAERIYGYDALELIGRDASVLYPHEKPLFRKLQDQLNRAAAQGYAGNEDWNLKKDGSRFWANVIFAALKDETGKLQGFAAAARDFSDRHKQDHKLRREGGRSRPALTKSTISGIVSGEFDLIPEANDAFLDIVGYTREDLQEGRLHWPEFPSGRVSARGRITIWRLHTL